MTEADWPAGSEHLRALVEACLVHGSEHLIANVKTRLMVLRDQTVTLPVTVNDGMAEERGNSWVSLTCTPPTRCTPKPRRTCSTTVCCALAALGLLDVAGAMLRAAQIDKMVQVNNWLLSTNLYPEGWSPEVADLTALTASLTRQFPGHFICFRSLNAWSNAPSAHRAPAAGYTLVASRQVYVSDHLTETWATHRDVKHDRRLLRRTEYRVVQNTDFSESDYPRVAELYDLLYRRKYPVYNPAFTAAYVRLCHQTGIMRFAGLRHPSGRLDGVIGMFTLGRTVANPWSAMTPRSILRSACIACSSRCRWKWRWQRGLASISAQVPPVSSASVAAGHFRSTALSMPVTSRRDAASR